MLKESQVRDRLLASARSEFLSCGYQKASLRKISTGAGVSTGSVYFFFGSKEDLFHAVVDEAANLIRTTLTEGAAREYSGTATGEENDRAFIACLHNHPEEAVILLENADDSPMSGFREEMVSLMEKSFLDFFFRAGGSASDAPLIRLLVEQRVQGVLSLVEKRFDYPTTMKYALLIGRYSEAGFQSLLHMYNEMEKDPA